MPGMPPAALTDMTDQLTLDALRDGIEEIGGMDGRARPAVSEAEVAPCTCPELCIRDHENE